MFQVYVLLASLTLLMAPRAENAETIFHITPTSATEPTALVSLSYSAGNCYANYTPGVANIHHPDETNLDGRALFNNQPPVPTPFPTSDYIEGVRYLNNYCDPPTYTLETDQIGNNTLSRMTGGDIFPFITLPDGTMYTLVVDGDSDGWYTHYNPLWSDYYVHIPYTVFVDNPEGYYSTRGQLLQITKLENTDGFPPDFGFRPVGKHNPFMPTDFPGISDNVIPKQWDPYLHAQSWPISLAYVNSIMYGTSSINWGDTFGGLYGIFASTDGGETWLPAPSAHTTTWPNTPEQRLAKNQDGDPQGFNVAPLGSLTFVQGKTTLHAGEFLYALAYEREWNASYLYLGRVAPIPAPTFDCDAACQEAACGASCQINRVQTFANWQWYDGRVDPGTQLPEFSSFSQKASLPPLFNPDHSPKYLEFDTTNNMAGVFWDQRIIYPRMQWNAAINRYLLTFTYGYYRHSHDLPWCSDYGKGVYGDCGPSTGGAELIVLESTNITGPFKFVFREKNFGWANGYAPSFPQGWMRPLSTNATQHLIMTFSSNAGDDAPLTQRCSPALLEMPGECPVRQTPVPNWPIIMGGIHTKQVQFTVNPSLTHAKY